MGKSSRPLLVEKIGGTSISNTDAVLEHVLLRRNADGGCYNRAFVVSAYAGITNKLLEHRKTGEPGVYALFAHAEPESSWCDSLDGVAEEMQRINREIFGDHADRRVADDLVRERIEGVRNCLLDLQRLCSFGHFRLEEHLMTVREMVCALGEAHSAHNTTLLLRQRGIDARFVDLSGWRDETHPTLDERIATALESIDFSTELPVVTGYAHCRDGFMRNYGRGYSEITFSRVAVVMNADEAIIHKEFHLSSADPRIVGTEKVRKIGRTNYDVADHLSNMEMEAIHPRAAEGLRRAGIPLRIKNTFDPDDPGTEITDRHSASKTRVNALTAPEGSRAEIVTGLKSVIVLQFFDPDMVSAKDCDAAVSDALCRNNIRIVAKLVNANTITHYLSGPLHEVERAAAHLRARYSSASITVGKVSIVSVIASDQNLAGLMRSAVAAVADAGVEILGLHQQMRNIDIQFVVCDEDHDKAIKALHRELVEEAAPREEQGRPARKAA
jgi:aspartate kinase